MPSPGRSHYRGRAHGPFGLRDGLRLARSLQTDSGGTEGCRYLIAKLPLEECALCSRLPPKLLPLETLISEYGPGQYELTLQYRSDLRRAADDLVMLKRLVRAVARRHGMTACFTALSFGLVHASPLSTLPPRIANGCSSLARQSARDYAAPELLWGAGPHPARLRCFKAGVILAMTVSTTSHARG
jgi:Glutamine synthetase, catalytic domain